MGIPQKNIFQWWRLWNAFARHLSNVTEWQLRSKAYSSPFPPSLGLLDDCCIPLVLRFSRSFLVNYTHWLMRYMTGWPSYITTSDEQYTQIFIFWMTCQYHTFSPLMQSVKYHSRVQFIVNLSNTSIFCFPFNQFFLSDFCLPHDSPFALTRNLLSLLRRTHC